MCYTYHVIFFNWYYFCFVVVVGNKRKYGGKQHANHKRQQQQQHNPRGGFDEVLLDPVTFLLAQDIRCRVLNGSKEWSTMEEATLQRWMGTIPASLVRRASAEVDRRRREKKEEERRKKMRHCASQTVMLAATSSTITSAPPAPSPVADLLSHTAPPLSTLESMDVDTLLALNRRDDNLLSLGEGE